MANQKIKKNMNKKGVLIEIGVIILSVVALIGTILVATQSEHLYVADKSLGQFYDYYLCKEKVNNINQTNIIILTSLDEAIKNYKPVEGCVNG